MTDEQRMAKLVDLAARAQTSEHEAMRKVCRLQREVAVLMTQKREVRRLLDRAAAIAETGDSVLMRAIIRTIIEVASV